MIGIVQTCVGNTPIDFRVDNTRKIAFTFPDSEYWLVFDEAYNTFKARIEAVKLCKYYDLSCIYFAYLDEIETDNLITIVNEKGTLTADIYSFRRFINSSDSKFRYEYLSDRDIFGEVEVRHSYWRKKKK